MRPAIRTQRLLSLLAVFGLNGACGSSLEADYADVVRTLVEPATIAAGETAAVTCEVLNDDGTVVPIATTFAVTPTDGLTVDGQHVTPTVVGVYAVTCTAPEYDQLLVEGAELTVVPGAPAKVTTEVAKSPVQVHEVTSVACGVEDAWGNVVTIETQVDADAGVIVSGHDIGSEAMGTYGIRCRVDGHPDTEVVPDELEVIWADPAVIDLIVTPDLPNYELESEPKFRVEVHDGYGNVVPPEEYGYTFTAPATGVILVDDATHRYALVKEGHFAFSATLDPPADPLTDERTLVVDHSGPALELIWPERGQQVLGDGDFVEVEGSVTDAFGEVAFFEIGGEKVPVAEDGSFTYEHLPAWGTNILLALAEDNYGNITKLSPTFQYSSEFLSFVETDVQGVKQLDGLEILIGQTFLDDGVHDPDHIDDLATLLEVLISGLDLEGLIAGLIGGTTGAGIEFVFPLFDIPYSFDLPFGLGSLDFLLAGNVFVTVDLDDEEDAQGLLGKTSVTLDSRLGGLDSTVTIGAGPELGLDLNLAIKAEFVIEASAAYVDGGGSSVFAPDPIAAGAYAELTSGTQAEELGITAKIDIHMPPGGDLTIDIKDIQLVMDELELDPIEDLELTIYLSIQDTLDSIGLGFITLPPIELTFMLSQLFDINALTDGILDMLTVQILPLILGLVEPLLEEFADGPLTDLISAFEIDQSFELPELLGPKPEPIMLDVYTNLSSVLFTDDGGQIGLSLGLYADKGVDRDPLGAIQRNGCIPKNQVAEFSYDWTRELGVAVKTDAINSALFALWWSGFLDGPIDLGGLLGGADLPIPISDIQLNLKWLLPPVLNDCGAKGVIELELGDLYATLDAELAGFPVSAVIYVDAAVGVFFGAVPDDPATGEPGGLTVQVGDFRYFDVEVLEAADLLGFIDLRDLLENQLQGLLEGFIVGESFGPIAIPPLDLGSLVPGLPAMVLNVGNLAVFKQQGYVVGGADLE